MKLPKTHKRKTAKPAPALYDRKHIEKFAQQSMHMANMRISIRFMLAA